MIVLLSTTSMIDWSACIAVERHPDRLGGAWAFRGTHIVRTDEI
jgi:hypothetical protein